MSTHRSRHLRPALLVVLMASTTGAWAQDDLPLRGPEVTPIKERTLVPSGMMGMTDKLDQRPEVAAIALLELSEEQQAAVQAVLLEHTRAVDEVFTDNIAQVQGWIGSLRAGSGRERMQSLRAIQQAFAPVRELGSLEDRIAKTLPEQAAAQYRQLISEYETSLEAEARRQAEAGGGRFEPMRHRMRRNFEKIGQDIKASYERTLKASGEDFERMLAEAQLSSEGEKLVRDSVRALAENSGFNPSPDDRRQAFMKILGELDREDRSRLLRAATGR